MTPTDIASLIPSKSAAAYSLNGTYDLQRDAHTPPEYHIQQARLYRMSDRRDDGSFVAFIGVVVRRRQDCFLVMGNGLTLGTIVGDQYHRSEDGQLFTLVEIEPS